MRALLAIFGGTRFPQEGPQSGPGVPQEQNVGLVVVAQLGFADVQLDDPGVPPAGWQGPSRRAGGICAGPHEEDQVCFGQDAVGEATASPGADRA